MGDNRHPIFAQAVDHFQAKGTRTIVVDEWADGEGNPAIIHYDPVNMLDKKKVHNIAKRDELGAFCDVLILKARDAEGSPIFTKEDKPVMMRTMDPNVIARIAKEILDIPDEEEMEKN